MSDPSNIPAGDSPEDFENQVDRAQKLEAMMSASMLAYLNATAPDSGLPPAQFNALVHTRLLLLMGAVGGAVGEILGAVSTPGGLESNARRALETIRIAMVERSFEAAMERSNFTADHIADNVMRKAFEKAGGNPAVYGKNAVDFVKPPQSQP